MKVCHVSLEISDKIRFNTILEPALMYVDMKGPFGCGVEESADHMIKCEGNVGNIVNIRKLIKKKMEIHSDNDTRRKAAEILDQLNSVEWQELARGTIKDELKERIRIYGNGSQREVRKLVEGIVRGALDANVERWANRCNKLFGSGAGRP